MEKFCRIATHPELIDEVRAALEPRGFVLDFVAVEPLAGVVSADSMNDSVRDYLVRANVIAPKDLGRLNLDALASAPGVDHRSLARFVRALAKSERYPNAELLQDFLVRRGIFI
jgi:hypothetical protein